MIKKFTRMSMVIVFLSSLFSAKVVSAQMPGSLIPLLILKHETGYWGDKEEAPIIKEADSDGDGIIDSKDKCPDVKGISSNDGCPEDKAEIEKDSDGDGIADSEDNCPEVKGTLKGCPDTDGDGVADADDNCPKVKGTIKGCPDSDNDGVIDSEDKCPNEKGTIKNEGCLLSKEELNIIKDASAHIYFETGSSRIKKESYSDLDKLVEVLKSHPEIKAKVEGYTDNTGNAAKNLELSKARAASVVKYLIEHGEKPDHISSEGYGIANPIATNETKEGRAKNRRVEVKVSNFK